jgi:hypothetical protein
MDIKDKLQISYKVLWKGTHCENKYCFSKTLNLIFLNRKEQITRNNGTVFVQNLSAVNLGMGLIEYCSKNSISVIYTDSKSFAVLLNKGLKLEENELDIWDFINKYFDKI